MRNLMVMTVLFLVAVFAHPGNAQAIINGQFDGDGHPYVGLVTDFETGACSGAAISPRIFVTAGHCVPFEGQEMFVTFDPLSVFGDAPLFHKGKGYPHPDFCIGCGHGLPGFDSTDVAVVVFDEDVLLSRYAALPPSGIIGNLSMGAEMTLVGYGIQHFSTGGGPPIPDAYFTRYKAKAVLVKSRHVISDEFITLSANPAKGKGGICFGDSGGPNLLAGTDTIVAINAFVTNDLCRGITYSYRVDTPDALDFIMQHLK